MLKCILGWRIGADNIFDIISVGVKKGKTTGSQPNPITVFSSKTIHNWHNLTFEFKHYYKRNQNLINT
jgi:hypothetical protein